MYSIVRQWLQEMGWELTWKLWISPSKAIWKTHIYIRSSVYLSCQKKKGSRGILPISCLPFHRPPSHPKELYKKNLWVASSHSAEHLAAFESPQLSISSADCFLCRQTLSTPSLQNKLPVAMEGNHSTQKAWRDGDSSSRHCLPQAEQPNKLQPFLTSGRCLLGNFVV